MGLQLSFISRLFMVRFSNSFQQNDGHTLAEFCRDFPRDLPRDLPRDKIDKIFFFGRPCMIFLS